MKPKDLAHLSSFRGLNKGELKNSGDAILEAITRGLAQAEKVVAPSFARIEAPGIEESQAMDLIRCYVGILADRHKIAAKHLMTTPQLLALLRNSIESSQDLIRYEILSEDAAKLIGDEVIAFVRGKHALYIRNAEIGVTEIDGSSSKDSILAV